MKNFLITFTAVLVAGGLLWGLNRNVALWEAEADRIVIQLAEMRNNVEDGQVQAVYVDKNIRASNSWAFYIKHLNIAIDRANKHLSRLSLGADTQPLEDAVYDARNDYERNKERWRELSNKPWQDQAAKYTASITRLTENLNTRADFNSSGPSLRQKLLEDQISYAEEHLVKFPEGADKTEIEAALVAAREAIERKNQSSPDSAD